MVQVNGRCDRRAALRGSLRGTLRPALRRVRRMLAGIGCLGLAALALAEDTANRFVTGQGGQNGMQDGAGLQLDGLTPEQQGLAIYREKERRESGYQDFQVSLAMILRDRRGTESRRELRISQLEVDESGDRLLVVFDTPPPIRGTALLSHSHKDAQDDQWLYLPAQNRVKKIASRNRSGPFLSSEFAYEDMALQELEKFDYRLMDIEPCGETRCYRIERTPLDEYSGYSRQEVLLDQEALRVIRVDFYDKHDRPLKILHNDGFELHQEQFWKASRMRMENLQTGKSTELLWEGFRFATGLEPNRDFSTNSLMRAR